MVRYLRNRILLTDGFSLSSYSSYYVIAAAIAASQQLPCWLLCSIHFSCFVLYICIINTYIYILAQRPFELGGLLATSENSASSQTEPGAGPKSAQSSSRPATGVGLPSANEQLQTELDALKQQRKQAPAQATEPQLEEKVQ